MVLLPRKEKFVLPLSSLKHDPPFLVKAIDIRIFYNYYIAKIANTWYTKIILIPNIAFDV